MQAQTVASVMTVVLHDHRYMLLDVDRDRMRDVHWDCVGDGDLQLNINIIVFQFDLIQYG